MEVKGRTKTIMKNIEKDKTYLITGGAGFIGFHLSKRLLGLGAKVIGLDNMNDYYDVSLKEARLNILTARIYNMPYPAAHRARIQ